MPNKKSVKKQSIKKIDKENNTTNVIEVTNPSVKVYHPNEAINNGVGILICPGGSYSILAFDKEGTEPASWLNNLGYTAYVLQYRIPNNREGAFSDIQRAFKLIHKNFGHKKLGVLGFSAGAHLAARLSTNFSKLSYQSVDDYDYENCKPDFTLLIYPAYLNEGKNKSISPNLTQDKNVSPIFIFGTEDDKYFNSIPVFTEYLKKIKTNFRLYTLKFGGHGYGLRKGNNAAETWPILAETWLNSIIK